MDTFHDGEEEGSSVVPLFRGAADMPLPVDATDDDEASDIAFSLSSKLVEGIMRHVYGGDTWEVELRERPTEDDDTDTPPPPPINIFRGRDKTP